MSEESQEKDPKLDSVDTINILTTLYILLLHNLTALHDSRLVSYHSLLVFNHHHYFINVILTFLRLPMSRENS